MTVPPPVPAGIGATSVQVAWLRRYGRTARVHDLADLADLAVRYGRPVPSAFDPRRPDAARAWLVAAQRP
jgi:hypothetical protein